MDTSSLDTRIIEPLLHISDTSSSQKNLHKKVIHPFALYFNDVAKEKINKIQEIINQVRDTSMIVDDLLHDSRIRRGVPSAHCVFGKARAITASHFSYLSLLEDVLELGGACAGKHFAKCMKDLQRGQALETQWLTASKDPSVAEYEEMVVMSVGSLLQLTIDLLQSCSNSEPVHMEELKKHFSLYLTLCDEWRTLHSTSTEWMGGRFTFSAVHCMSQDTSCTVIQHIVRDKLRGEDSFRLYKSTLTAQGSVEALQSRLCELKAMVLQDLHTLQPPNAELEHIVELMSGLWSGSGGGGEANQDKFFLSLIR